MDKSGIVFETTLLGNRTCCGVSNGFHRFANERNKHGHYPGIVYLIYLPKGQFKGKCKIGKVEHTDVETDDFDLDKIHNQLLERLHGRFHRYHPGRGRFDAKYDGAQFVHGIRVACGEGGEKQPQAFFTNKGKWVKHEIFSLGEDDIEIFKSAKGEMLDRPIKHILAEEFAKYLSEEKGLMNEDIKARVLLPRALA